MSLDLRPLLLALLLPACGEPLADASYHGEPLITISGEILVEEPLGEEAALATVGLFWSQGPQETPQRELSVQVEVDFPNSYRLQVFRPPPESVIHASGRDGELMLAMGLLLLYLDRDGDGDLDFTTEEVIGTAPDVALQWVVDAGEIPTGPDGEPIPLETYTPIERPDGCAERGPPLPIEASAVYLALGEVCELVIDLDCDGRQGEWGDLCPPGP